MSEEFEEYEIENSPGKYPKSAFTGIFKGYEYTTNDNKTKELKLKFDEDTYITIYGRGKLKDGKATGRLADYLNSLKACGIKKNIAIQQDGELIALRHEPDIIDAKISIEPFIEPTRGDDDQNKDSIWWGKVTHIILDGTKSASAPKPASTKSKPKEKTPAAPTTVVPEALKTEIIDELIVGARSIGELFDLLQHTHKPKEIREAIEQLKVAGNVQNSQQKDKYELI